MPGAPPLPLPPESPAVASPASRWRIVLPASAFLSGFVWDAFTLGREIKPVDLLILSAYFVAAAVILVLMGRRVTFRFSSKLNLALQFLFGGMFSALVVLYFLSSAGVKGFMVVLALALILVTNEFLGERYDRLSLSWALFGVCGVMLLNFLLPYLTRSIHPIWFYASLGAASAVVLALRKLSRNEDAVLWPTLAAAAFLAVLHLVNLIPPVPLVARATVVSSELAREGDAYVMRGRSVRGFWPLRPRTLVRDEGQPVYCFTSVFVPRGIETTITHRWMRLDAASGRWETTDRISFRIAGGRRDGYRGYSRKRTVSDGEWMVVAEAESGAAIASTRFRISTGASRRARDFVRRF
jgi:hypothetical protein